MARGRALLVLMVGFVVLLGAWAGTGVLRDRAETIEGGFRDAGNLADALAEQTAQTMASTDQALSGLVSAIDAAQIEDPAQRGRIFDLLSERQKVALGTYAYFIVDARGRLVHSSRTRDPDPMDLSASEYVTRARATQGSEMTLTRPFQGRAGYSEGRWIIVASRPLRAADGTVQAVFAAAMSVDYLSRFYDVLDVGPGGMVSLFRRDGTLLATHPFREALLGTSRADLPLFTDHLATAASGRFLRHNPSDEAVRLISYRTIANYPLVVAVGLGEGWVLAPWRTRALRSAAEIGLMALLILVLTLYARRLLNQRAAADVEQSRRLNLLARASLDLARTRSADAMLKAAAAVARSLVGCHQAMISLDAGAGRGQVVQAISVSDRYGEWRTRPIEPAHDGIDALAGRTGLPVRRTRAESAAAAADGRPPVRGLLAVPLVAQDGGNLGIVRLSDRDKGDFTADDEAISQQLALMIATLFENFQIEGARHIALAAETAARLDQEASRVEAELARQRTEQILESISDAFYVLDRDFRFRHLNRKAEGVMGQGLVGRNIWEAFPEAARNEIRPAYETAMAKGEAVAFVVFYPPLDTWFDVNVYPFEGGLSVFFRDVSEKVEMEAKLHQAQKMEAVGQLTGGIAHDFNNLLTVILGMGEAILASPMDHPELRERVEAIVAAGERGAELTNSLLSFSRRQPLAPTATDAAQLLRRMEGLLRGTLGEGIEIEVATSGGLWRAMVDPGQLELAILNLAINARDAMPAGGRLTIEAGNARLDEIYAAGHPEVAIGQYVLVAVSDTGTGMSEEVIRRAFEPFFTTKDVGKGSGLGLSMVYGFVKQSGGHIKIYSEIGEGTAVKLYLPRAVQRAGGREEREPPEVAADGGGSVLVVEDSDDLRRLITQSLTVLGYEVATAASSAEALETAGARPFDLLLTDVMLPGGSNGRDLANEVQRRHPAIRVLYMSGYTENAIVHHGRLDSDVLLLRKPFRRADLARMVRLALGDAWQGK